MVEQRGYPPLAYIYCRELSHPITAVLITTYIDMVQAINSVYAVAPKYTHSLASQRYPAEVTLT